MKEHVHPPEALWCRRAPRGDQSLRKTLPEPTICVNGLRAIRKPIKAANGMDERRRRHAAKHTVPLD